MVQFECSRRPQATASLAAHALGLRHVVEELGHVGRHLLRAQPLLRDVGPVLVLHLEPRGGSGNSMRRLIT